MKISKAKTTSPSKVKSHQPSATKHSTNTPISQKPERAPVKTLNKQLLLDELESIYAALDSTHLATKAANKEPNETDMPLKTADRIIPTPKEALPGQQSLFEHAFDEDEREDQEQVEQQPKIAASAEKDNPKANPENPFFPQHVKDTLAKEKQQYQRDLESVAKLSFGQEQNAQYEALIDHLVARYLPKIEAELRDELKRLIDLEDADT